jgi:hypothetical protein
MPVVESGRGDSQMGISLFADFVPVATVLSVVNG